MINAYFKVGEDRFERPEIVSARGVHGEDWGVGMVVVLLKAPQVSVLRHESTRAFLSHSEWNLVRESVSHDMLVIKWFLYCDQRMNTTMLAKDMGVAIKPAAAEPKRTVI